jgi:hypothetical protein
MAKYLFNYDLTLLIKDENGNFKSTLVKANTQVDEKDMLENDVIYYSNWSALKNQQDGKPNTMTAITKVQDTSTETSKK